MRLTLPSRQNSHTSSLKDFLPSKLKTERMPSVKIYTQMQQKKSIHMPIVYIQLLCIVCFLLVCALMILFSM